MKKTNSIFRKNFCARRSAKSFCLSIFTIFCILPCATYISAQTNGAKRRAKVKVSQAKPERFQKQRMTKLKNGETVNENNAVRLVNRVETDYLSGEANVSVNPKQPTVIRLGLAQNATSVVEFPFVDQIYYIHEGNPRLVTVFQSPTKETDRSITLYPGEGFLPNAASRSKRIVGNGNDADEIRLSDRA